ncbi:MAG TPA: hypothetical protein VME46_02495 [Acidimicrobiales bacterium]|nr:hypothetical protein [Acidimicrobiales bacterium]
MEQIICRKCGTHADTGEAFCGNCGAFLEWEGERITVDPVPGLELGPNAMTAGTPPPAAGTGWTATSGGANAAAPSGPPVGGGAATLPRPPTGTPPFVAAGTPPPPTYPPPPPPSGSRVPPPPALGGQPVAGQATNGPVPANQGPAAVQPALPIERPKTPPPRMAPSRRAAPGDLYCGQCGQPNGPERRFCRRCGALLAEAPPPPPRLPWWKRLFHRDKAAAGRTDQGTGPSSAMSPAAATATAPPSAAGGAAAAPSAGPPPPPAAHSAGLAAPKPPAGGSASSPSSPSAPPRPQPYQPPRPPAAGGGQAGYPPQPAYHPYSPPRPYGGSGAGYRPPSGLPPKGHRLRNTSLIVLLVVVVVCAVDPSARNGIDRGFNRVRYDLIPTYANVPLEKVRGEGSGACGPLSMAGNDTVYWYTQPAGTGLERIFITLAPSFRGTIGRIVFTPLKASGQAATTVASSAALPAPEMVRVSVRPPGAVTVTNLDNPPKLQAIKVDLKITAPSVVIIRALTTDPGATPSSCAETGVVLNQRKS